MREGGVVMKIKEVEDLVGITKANIRYYEKGAAESQAKRRE